MTSCMFVQVMQMLVAFGAPAIKTTVKFLFNMNSSMLLQFTHEHKSFFTRRAGKTWALMFVSVITS